MILKELKYHVFYRNPGKNIHLCSSLLDYTQFGNKWNCLSLYIITHEISTFLAVASPQIFIYIQILQNITIQSMNALLLQLCVFFCVSVHDDNASIFNFEGGLVYKKFNFVCTQPKLKILSIFQHIREKRTKSKGRMEIKKHQCKINIFIAVPRI